MSGVQAIEASLSRLGRAVMRRSVPNELAAALRVLPGRRPDHVPETLLPASDSRVSSERTRTRGPTLGNSHLLTFGSATIDVAIDVFPDDDSTSASLRGVVLMIDTVESLTVRVGNRSIRCDDHATFTIEGIPFGRHGVRIEHGSEELARFTIDVD